MSHSPPTTAHAHDHARHRPAAIPGRAEPRISALGRSGLERLFHAAIVVALLWAAVFWAMS
ncbi:hypothetical protein [Methylocystis heyeri]|uniref:Uncharacterized protein n=1 Tax=Methylocystis heyeri TaxID=391905 RepID=A0A6B8KGG8_9HYPH|nr:hypothetical protein [Methylocystis heyeri]QGM45648.1 hypothetical protein H2LOC_008010 [Methylocystis heyeri]